MNMYVSTFSFSFLRFCMFFLSFLLGFALKSRPENVTVGIGLGIQRFKGLSIKRSSVRSYFTEAGPLLYGFTPHYAFSVVSNRTETCTLKV